MSDDPLLKIYEVQAELRKIKEEMKEIQKKNDQLKNEITFKHLTETVNEVQSKVDVFQQTVTASSNRGKQTILLVGGKDCMDDDGLLVLESNGQDWKELNIKLPHSIDRHGAQFLNNSLYIFGGEEEKEGTLNSTYKLSKSVQWERVADMNQRRSEISNSSVILNNQIWVCGGGNSTVEMYDPETNEWKYMKEMNECRWDAAATVVNGKIFCSGGFTTSVEYYDPSSDVWTLICDMPEFISGHGAIELNGHLIVMGGYDLQDRYFNNVWTLDTTDKNAVWIEKPPMSIPRKCFSIAKIHGKIFVCGGHFADQNIDLTEVFDGEVWRNGPKMPSSRYSVPAVAIPTQFARELIEKIPEEQAILLLGGSDGNAMDSLVMLKNNGPHWKKLKIKLPYKVYGHGAQFLNNNLYVFGGDLDMNLSKFTYKLSKSLQWEKMADMNEKRCGISNSSVILNNQIWVCGGRSNDWLDQGTKSVEMYDPETNEWKFMKEMNEYRWDAGTVVVNGKIFCCGGRTSNSVECYDLSSNVWTLISTIPENPDKISGHCAVEMNGNLIVMGGEPDCLYLSSSTVWTLDTTNKNAVWIKKPSKSKPLMDSSIAKIHDKIFVCGGADMDCAGYEVEIFDGDVWRNGPALPSSRVRAPAVVIPMEFAKKLVNGNIVVAADLNVHNNADESLTQIPFKASAENFPEEQTILLFGGDKGDSLLMLENDEQSWKELNIKLPHSIDRHGAQFLNNSLYIFGGEEEKEGTLNSTYKLSKSVQWEKMADMNEKRYDISNSSVILNDQIWVCGGWNGEECLNSVEMYDPETNIWKFMKEMSLNQSLYPAAAVVNGKIFCSSRDSVEYYDPSSDVWTIISDIPVYIEGYGAAEMNGNFIVMGGEHQIDWQVKAEYWRNVWALDTTDENAVWIEKPSMVIPRCHFSIAKIGRKIFICGGYNEEGVDYIEIFDGEVWRIGPKMPTSRREAPAVVIPMQFARYFN